MKQISRHSPWFKCCALALFVTLPHCKPRSAGYAVKSGTSDAGTDGCGNSAVCSLPSLLDAEQVAAIEQTVRNKIGRKAPPEVVDEIAPKITHYMSFLGIPVTESQVNAAGNKVESVFDKTLARVLESSTQFLVCESFEDWVCLQRDPNLVPKAPYRQTSEADKGLLGEPIDAGPNLDMDMVFTHRFAKPEKWTKQDPVKTMSYKLADIIADRRHKRISMAAYGIRSIGPDDSMFPVFSAIGEQVKRKVDIRAVTDQVGQLSAIEGKEVYFTYVDQATARKNKMMKNDQLWVFSKPDPQFIMPKPARAVEEGGEEEEEEPEQEEKAPDTEQWISYT